MTKLVNRLDLSKDGKEKLFLLQRFIYVWPISYLCYRYNYMSYLFIYTALVKRNHSDTLWFYKA